MVAGFFRVYVQHFESLVDLLLPFPLSIGLRDSDTLPAKKLLQCLLCAGITAGLDSLKAFSSLNSSVVPCVPPWKM